MSCLLGYDTVAREYDVRESYGGCGCAGINVLLRTLPNIVRVRRVIALNGPV